MLFWVRDQTTAMWQLVLAVMTALGRRFHQAAVVVHITARYKLSYKDPYAP